jgi:hypothetical protein
MTSITPTAIRRAIVRSGQISRPVHDDDPVRQCHFDTEATAVTILKYASIQLVSASDGYGELPLQEQLRPTAALVIFVPFPIRRPATEVIRITKAYRWERTRRRFAA